MSLSGPEAPEPEFPPSLSAWDSGTLPGDEASSSVTPGAQGKGRSLQTPDSAVCSHMSTWGR